MDIAVIISENSLAYSVLKLLIVMRKILMSTLLMLSFTTQVNAIPVDKNFYEYNAKSITGEEVKLDLFRGKVALVVNTASNCGFTSQYQGLEELYQKYKDQGFVVLAFPSNDFGGQEPGKNEEIKHFCELKYKTTFPIFEKNPVKGVEKQPVYKFLTENSEKKFQGDPGWNFVKFLVDQQGQVVGRYASITTPTSKKIVKAIEGLLGK